MTNEEHKQMEDALKDYTETVRKSERARIALVILQQMEDTMAENPNGFNVSAAQALQGLAVALMAE